MMRRFYCPVCKKEVERNSDFFPFCGERCKLIDLGNWADGSYAIPGGSADLEEEEKPPRLH